MSNKTSDKNVAKVEEDVKIVHKIISFYKDLDTLYDNDKCKEIQALERILAELEQKDKRIQELEKENKENRKKYLKLLIGQFPDTAETYKKCKKELQELLEGRNQNG